MYVLRLYVCAAHTCDAFLLPGRFMMTVCPLTPQTGLEIQAQWGIIPRNRYISAQQRSHTVRCVCLLIAPVH